MSISAVPYREFLRQKEAEFFSLVNQGAISPWVFPHDFLVLIIPILVLLIPNKGQSWVIAIRRTTFGLVSSLAIKSLLHTRCLTGGGTVIGFYYVFIVIWTALLLLFKDVQNECFRIERSSDGTLYWQGYPDSRCHRLSWSLDMFGSLRGAGWNWRIPGLPPLPKISSEDQQTSTDGKELPQDAPASDFLRTSFLRTARYYLLMDFLKVLTMLDPYFWGLIDAAPLYPLDRINHFSPALLHLFRAVVTVLWIRTSMAYIASMVPLIISLAVTVCPALIKWTRIPLEAPWLYPPLFNSFFDFKPVFDYGLEGWWGRRWHQAYRYAFSETARHVVPDNFENKDMTRFLRHSVAFLLSGLVHFCAVHSHFVAPGSVHFGALLFFMLQPLGLLVQRKLRGVLFSEGSIFWRVFNVISTYAWLYLVIGPFCDDLAAAGTWVYDEACPISIIRGLGFIEGEGWFVGTRRYVQIWTGEKWWQTGIQIL
ncbi:hypothetical protein Asppvi_006994 [Aspergillus pseudoviridinutans]|uniref:Wax synthase domain-containing protein n=1 Tax=Aspergillus pseudoviridinutans TaxID=1517512 RepID=A0A9P3BFB9_9EURO|nr:uncharacterized protein Asppvi_006994 [Aspergillus pseudoviridinutans]GIJ88078.1 hypothetical protein Asppvi_006994 [Aspergillus pseudoviridinutans]